MIAGLFPELLAIGGVQLAGRHLAAALQRMADDDHTTAQFLSLNDPRGENEFTIANQRIKFCGFARDKGSFLRACVALAGRDPQLVLAAHPNLALAGTMMKLRRPGLPLAVCTHGVEVWNPLPIVRRLALRRADLVLAPSRFTAERVSTVQGVPPSKTLRLPWALDPEFLKLAESSKRASLPLAFPKGRVILAAGRWSAAERYKGVDRLIEALPEVLASVPDAHLVAVGEGDDLPRLQGIAAERAVSARVSFFPPAHQPELISYYENCDVFALPSSGEGFGFVFLEAMALGKPVIGGAHGGTPDIIEDGVTGYLVGENDSALLVSRLIALLTDKALRRRMGQAGRQRAIRDFSFTSFQQALEQALTSIRQKHRGEN
jgi:glycosyltransferase involved in cell wall biosynthesis